MVIGLDEKEKTLEEALDFNKDNIFEYLTFLLFSRNANWFGTESDCIVSKLNDCIKDSVPSYDIQFELENMITDALNKTSQYAYEAGFKEACRLNKTLNSF